MEGRFFQSVKTVLPDPGFTHTRINGKPFSAEDLVAVMLRHLRRLAEEASGASIDRAVIGRPARFSDDPEREAVAQERLERAVAQAGITEAAYELEPVAGAYAYAAQRAGDGPGSDSSIQPRTVFVADHGGGTSDFTVMDLADDGSGRPQAQAVRATHGIRAGGDDFDGAIMWNRLTEQFGRGTHFESFGKMLPVPIHIFHIISRWDQIHFLKTLSYREELRTYLHSSDNPMTIRRLIKLVEENLGYFIFRAIESAKIVLSESGTGTVDYENGKLRIHESVARDDFERYIAKDTERIAEAVALTIGLANDSKVDTVFLTGGSSRVPAIREVVRAAFPDAHLIADENQFQSVSFGLALAARDRGLRNP